MQHIQAHIIIVKELYLLKVGLIHQPYPT